MMKNRSQSQLASILTFGIGAWLMVSPLFITIDGAALANVLIVGGIIAIAGLAQLFLASTTPSWIAAVTSAWLLVSAFLFDANMSFIWSATLSAVAAFALAVWDGIEVSHLLHARHSTHTS